MVYSPESNAEHHHSNQDKINCNVLADVLLTEGDIFLSAARTKSLLLNFSFNSSDIISLSQQRLNKAMQMTDSRNGSDRCLRIAMH
jgi:hypothetical protein